ncbi:electron transport complex subunit RsxC [Treponema parvum]|uniref:Ion-translocating oxidoreductase complex subunit C n=1 Tax=Treponema parvum TaxID=138851 RepID=A0A975IE44_9SPIR|nr:electron transport complex subunit RsxC [Treponema parvum]QTQ13482.1 electron transport complex subunit RsxC [Treponema parvum]
MKTYTFKGGIHPPERKEPSKDSPITEAFPSSKTVVIPLTMGGAPNAATVKAGDKVVKGQVIADSQEFISAPVHASVSGTVKEIGLHLVTGNLRVQCVTIEGDGSNSYSYMEPLDPFKCSREEAVKRIRDAGIVGMSGASFPTHVKLSPPSGVKVEYLILNGAECEPYLTVDYRTMKEFPHKVIDGLAIVMKITGTRGVIAIENNKADLEDILKSEIIKQNRSNEIEVRVIKTKYPQGCEKTLIKTCTGREVPAGGLPADIGCIVSNVGTVCAVSDAFRLGKPLIERALTFSGGSCLTPKNLFLPVGTLVSDLIPEAISIKEDETVKILSGGPMMGAAMSSPDFPIEKGTSGILFLTKEELCLEEEKGCIGCGKCIDACPMNLTPAMLVRALKVRNTEKAKKFGLMDCIECGCCAYVCPSNIPIVQKLRLGKSIVKRQLAQEKARASAAKPAGGKA